MRRREFLISAASAYLAATNLGRMGRAMAQAGSPTGPVTIYVPFAAGGASDILTRVVADYARSSRNLPVGVEFKPGAGATIAPAQVARSAPDGATLGFYSVSPFLTVPHLQSLPYKTLSDFTFISIYAFVPIAVYVAKDSPLQDWQGLLKFAKDNTGKLRWGTSGVRGVAHLAVEAAFQKEGVKATFVPFGGGADAITALLGNHIEAVVSADYGPQLAAGRVRLLAFTGTERLATQPKLPTFKELGYPLATEALYGIYGPAKLPEDTVSYWETLTKEMIGTEVYKTALATANAGSVYLNSAEFTANVAENYKRLGEQIETLGFKMK
jgi:tripartite-type tricarboxylate transporter receptor subunit TctC